VRLLATVRLSRQVRSSFVANPCGTQRGVHCPTVTRPVANKLPVCTFRLTQQTVVVWRDLVNTTYTLRMSTFYYHLPYTAQTEDIVYAKFAFFSQIGFAVDLPSINYSTHCAASSFLLHVRGLVVLASEP
jgi:hypothetical protein